MSDILSRIGDGHRNALERSEIGSRSDRQHRKAIEQANKTGDCIINVGNGYYRPLPSDPVDEKEFKEYIRKEKSRIREISDKILFMQNAFYERARGECKHEEKQIR